MQIRMLCVVMLVTLTGCPLENPENSGAISDLPSISGAAGDLAQKGGDMLSDLVRKAQENRFPPAPSLATLCQLSVGQTSYKQAKELIGPPQSESMDATMAGLSYRFRPVASGAAGAMAPSGGAGGSAAEDEAQPITLYLSFTWSDGSPGAGCLLTGIGCSPQDLLMGYILEKMSISGHPYPDCWPHEEE